MRDFNGIPFASLPDPKSPDFHGRLRNILASIDTWARDVGPAIRRIQNGENPDGSGYVLTTKSLSSFTNSESTVGLDTANLATLGDVLLVNTTDVQSVNGPVDFFSDVSVAGTTVVGGNLTLNDNTKDVNILCNDFTVQALSGGIYGLGTVESAGFDFGGGAFVMSGSPPTVLDSLCFTDSNTNYTGTLSAQGIGSGAVYTFPPAGGALISVNSTQTLANKTLDASTKVRCNTASGATFQDNSTTTKQMRFDLSGISASSTRNLKFPDLSSSPVVVGNTTAASGTLGISDLTGQTGSVAAVTLLTGTTTTAGMYRVSCYLKCTTAGTAGTVKATVSFNDGTAQTLDIPLLTTAGVAGTLSLTTLNGFAQGECVVYAAASQNITYTTTVTGATGSPQYTVRVRIERLG